MVIRLTQPTSICALPLIHSADHRFGYCWPWLGIPDKIELCQLCLCIPIWECLVHNWIWSSSRVRVGTRLFRYWRGLVAGKNCWQMHEWSVTWSTIIFRSGFCRWCHFTCRTAWTPRTCTWDDGIKGHISRARAELAKVPPLGSREHEPSTITAGQEAAVVEESVYLGSLFTFTST